MRTRTTRIVRLLALLARGWGGALLAGAVLLGLASVLAPPAWGAEVALSAGSDGTDDAAHQAEVARQQRLQEAKILAARGRELVASGAYAEARDALREALRLDPDDAAARKLLGQAEAGLGIKNGDDLLARTRERHTFKSLVLRQQVQLDLFEGEKALKEGDGERAAQQAERALATIMQVDDAKSAAELRARAEKLLADARSATVAAAAGRRQADLDRAKALAAAEKAQRAREQAEGLRVLRAQGEKFFEAKDYDKALAIAEQMERADPGNRDAKALRDKVREATAVAGSLRDKSHARRESESHLMAEIEAEMTPLKPKVVLAADRRRSRGSLATGPLEPWQIELRSKLATPVAIEFRETPLAQAVEQLATVGGVNIIVDPEAAATPATLTIPKAKMPLESMLRWVAHFSNLQYCVRDGAVLLTTRNGALDAPVTKVYDVSALLAPPTGGEEVLTPGAIEPGPRQTQVVEVASPDPEPIGRGWVEFVKSTIAADTWDRNDTLQQRQPYTIQYRNGRIVVVHTPDVQKQIEDLLNDFRKARTLQVHMIGRFITIERKFLDSLNISMVYGKTTTSSSGDVDTHTGSIGLTTGYGWTGVPSLAEFDSYTINGGLAIRYSMLDDESLVVLMKAVIHEGKGTVLEAPRLTCYNTQRANIQVLTNYNYIRRIGTDFVPEIGNIPDGTIFDIQPFVSSDRRYITLICQPQMRTFQGFTTFTYGTQLVQVTPDTYTTVTMTVELPTTELRSVGTTVTVPNGGTILMGGFTNVTEHTGLATSPFLDGIPLLKYIFRGRDHIEGRRTLIMLITAQTVEDMFEEEE